MKSFPMFIRTSGRRIVIVGDGEQAAQKARLILKTDAAMTLAATAPEPELRDLIDSGRVTWHRGRITPALFEGAAMGFVATGCPGLDAAMHGIAQAARCPVNVVDQPALCDLTTPSLVDRDPVVVAIGTEGTAPVLARQIKTKIEETLPPNLGGLAALAGRLRDAVAQSVPRAGRRAFWAWVFAGEPHALWTRGAERHAAQRIKSAIRQGQAPETDTSGAISLVGAGPGARDLLTLRAVSRLQEADVIFYDRLIDPEVLELARRDAERVYVGKTVGACAWPQEKINALIIAEAQKGRKVVRLKSGDPGIFGRAGEEMTAAETAGIPVEIVPGVTAACAAGASAGVSLTQRGLTDTLVLSTATGAHGGGLPESARLSGPGTTTAFYMATRQARTIETALIDQGLPPEAPVTLVVEASKPNERVFCTKLGNLHATIAREDVTGCAIILVSWPKSEDLSQPKRLVAAE